MSDLPSLHVGGASAVSVIISLIGIFFLMLIMSFAFWRGPGEHRRFSGPWFLAWAKASAPRIVVAGVFCAGLFVASALSGGGDSDASDPTLCETGLPALTNQVVSQERLTGGVLGLRALAAAADQGDLERARALIFSDAHNITHDIDPQLRPSDPDLARDLCRSVLALENEIAQSDPDLGAIATESIRAANLLEQASDILATTTATPDPFAQPGSGACDNPIGAATTDPITTNRLDNAISKLEAVAQAATEGDTALIAQLFFGDAHDITHDIDGPLRDADLDLAKHLCLSVLTLEIQLAGAYELSTIEREASNSAQLLADAGQALGIAE